MNKVNVKVAIVSLLLGASLMYLYTRLEKDRIEGVTMSIMGACYDAEGINQEIQNNCKSYIGEVLSCASDAKCDYKASTTKLTGFAKDIDSLQDRKSEISERLLKIAGSTKQK